MKKKVIFAAVAVVVGVSCYIGNESIQKSNKLTDLQLNNAEALSSGESLVDACNYYCYSNKECNCLLYTNNLGTITCLDAALRDDLN